MEFVIIIALLLCNGLFAMYEIALVSSSKVRVRSLAGQGKRNATRVLRQMEAPEQTLSTIQIGITLIGIVSGAFGGMTLAADVEPLFAQIPRLAAYAGKLSVIVTIALITYLSLIVGELVPKSIALNKPERYAMLLAPLIQALTWLCYPFVWLLSVSTRFVSHLLGIEISDERPMTQEELKMILRQSSEQGVIDAHETEMLQDVFRFADKRVNELMTPRHEMVVMHVTDSRQQVMETIRKCNFSKYVLVGGTRDDVRGIVSVKDIVLMIEGKGVFDLQNVVRSPLFLPETLYAKKAVELFKKNKTKFAVVVNEYGGTEGIVTLHDLTESIFGDILEENEAEEPDIVRRTDGSFLVDGAMNVDDFMEEMNVGDYSDIEDEGFTTMGGLAMFRIGRLPVPTDTFDYRNMHFEVVDMDGERVDKLLVTVAAAPDSKEENESR